MSVEKRVAFRVLLAACLLCGHLCAGLVRVYRSCLSAEGALERALAAIAIPFLLAAWAPPRLVAVASYRGCCLLAGV